MAIEDSASLPSRPTRLARRWLKLYGIAIVVAGLAIALIVRVDAPPQPIGGLQPVAQFVAHPVSADGWLPIESFLNLSRYDYADSEQLLDHVEAHWRDGYAPILMEASRFGLFQRAAVLRRLRTRYGLAVRADSDATWRRLWQIDYQPHPDYARFKAQLYQQIDPRFAAYFQPGEGSNSPNRQATIRLDEVRWGGVVRDGIPPLNRPEMIAASEATYLADSDVVFGIEVNGDLRAYPKRILAWHEMFKDTVGGVSVNGVYCTLCGMMILYETEHDGVHHELGTSGFLYRSNKLMYDHATESMWSTTRGVPVIGPLVGQNIKLKVRPVVTTTWGQWRQRHPETTVLSLRTGHRRDYGEGVAYREYFATDQLMFTVPNLPVYADTKEPLANKGEVLALRFGDDIETPLAIHTNLLSKNPVYHGEYGSQRYVVVTDNSGANRVYAADDWQFTTAGNATIRDQAGGEWTVGENELAGPNGITLPRLPAHRAFWFGWRAAHPDTKLIGG